VAYTLSESEDLKIQQAYVIIGFSEEKRIFFQSLSKGEERRRRELGATKGK
jgi:hypothetical protein